jgi:hypothetical protein
MTLAHLRPSPIPAWIVAATLLAAFGAAARADAGVRWLGTSAAPRSVSDPREPRFAVFLGGDPERVETALGAPFPLLDFQGPGGRMVLVLEGGAFLTLRRERSRFPLETADGLFGLALEGVRGRVVTRLRLTHTSAHKVDGDSTVAFAETYSKEVASLEAGIAGGRTYTYARIGAAWHAIPRDRGVHLSGGFQWWGAGSWRPLASVHLDLERERSWRAAKSLFLGLETGQVTRFRLGLRAFTGPSPRGQYWARVERFAGAEIQFAR